MSYIETFTKTLLKHSNSKEYDSAIKEWRSYGIDNEGEEENCICGHYIKINCLIINIINKNILTVGNCCIKKFGINRQHFNGSKLNYVRMCLQKCNNQRDIDFCNKTKRQIEKGYMFYDSQLKRLQKISGIKSRFKSFENSSKHKK